MSLFSFEFLSHYPESKQDNSTFFIFPHVASIRFSINSIIKPKGIRIKIGNKVIYEERTIYDNINPNRRNKIFYNVWLNLSESNHNINHIKIECNFFGIYIPIKKAKYKLIDEDSNQILANSDSYIPRSLISSKVLQGKDLEQEIVNIPAAIRSSATADITKEIQSIIVLRLDQLGDFVLTVSAFLELKNIFPSARFTVLVSKANEHVAHATGLFDKVIPISFSFIEKTNQRSLNIDTINAVQEIFNNNKYDLAVDLSPMPETRELLKHIPANVKFGFENTNTYMIDVGILIHAKDPVNWRSNVSHAAYPLIIVDSIKRILQPKICHLPLTKQSSKVMSRLELLQHQYIVVHSGARNLLVRWPMENYINLSLKLSVLGDKIVFFADEPLTPVEKLLLTKDKKILVIDYKLEFNEFDEVIANSKLFIGNDSGPKHLAAMRNTPVVSIHSPRTNWSEWGQIDSGIIISKRFPCAGCAITDEYQCARRLQCVSSISVEEVFSAIIENMYRPS